MKTKKSAKENPDSKSIAFITKCHFAFSTKNSSGMISNLIMIYIKRERKAKNNWMQIIKKHQLLYLREDRGLFTCIVEPQGLLLCRCLIVSGVN